MTQQRRTALKELQRMDLEIERTKQSIHDFDPLFEQVELPALTLQSELTTGQARLKEMRLEARKLDSTTEEKRERRKRLEERLMTVRNLREEAAVSAELEMIKRTLQQDEQEALTLGDQLQKVEERMTQVEASLQEANALVEPQRNELLAQRSQAEGELAALENERSRFAAGIPPAELRTYDAIRSGGRRVAVAELTEDGACGNCFGMVPLQLRNEVRHATGLIRCEGCGVILTAPEAIAPGDVAKSRPAATVAATAAREVDDADAGEDESA